jgi:hypothetical protein
MFCCPRCSHLSTILNNIVEPESGVTILFNIVDNCEQCGQQSIVQSCFHQHCNNLSVFTRVDQYIHGWLGTPSWYRQAWTMLCGQLWTSCQPCCSKLSVDQCCNNMLTILFIVGRTTLFTPVDINLEQVVDFLNFYACITIHFRFSFVSVLRHVMYTIVDRYYMTMKEILGASLRSHGLTVEACHSPQIQSFLWSRLIIITDRQTFSHFAGFSQMPLC